MSDTRRDPTIDRDRAYGMLAQFRDKMVEFRNEWDEAGADDLRRDDAGEELLRWFFGVERDLLGELPAGYNRATSDSS